MSPTTPFTLDQLKRIMFRCAGVDESVDLGGDIGELTFAELGYDSLAVMEMAAQIRHEVGVTVPDAAMELLTTPRLVVDFVNDRTAAV
jgi:act minimal PKS acyl carrier protein